LYTHAGPEIAVATTKAYSAQLAALYLLAIALACARGMLDAQREQALIGELLALPGCVKQALGENGRMRELAQRLKDKANAFFIGRGLDYAACLEGSLKLKEVSYIHSEAYAAGELKHGAISLIEPGMPVIGVATQTIGKTAANMAEAASRGAYLVAVVPQGEREAGEAADFTVYLPHTEPLFAPSVAAVPLQLLAYHISCARGLDVDKPRNLAKSVTVE